MRIEIDQFTGTHADWVIEGAYADLLELLLDECSELVFVNAGIEPRVFRWLFDRFNGVKREFTALADA